LHLADQKDAAEDISSVLLGDFFGALPQYMREKLLLKLSNNKFYNIDIVAKRISAQSGIEKA